MNRKEAQANYKRLYDKSAKPVSYEIGQEVLLKKNFGKHLKASVPTLLLKKWVQLTLE